MAILGKLRSSLTPKRLAAILVALATILVVVRVARAQTFRPIPLVSDWSHHHVVYSRPSSWISSWRIQGDIRYWQQSVRRTGFAHPTTDQPSRAESGRAARLDQELELDRRAPRDESAWEPRRTRIGGWPRRERLDQFHRDWQQPLGNGGTTGTPINGVNWWPVYPAKFAFDVSAAPSCATDFVVYPTNLAGATNGQASLIAYNNLYSGTGASLCNRTTPTVYWAYNTNFTAAGAASNGTVATSPIFSSDGSMLAFVETRTAANGGSILHLLKWKSAEGTAIGAAASPTIATSWTADGAAGHCPVSGGCMISIAFNGAQSDTGSSPYYDYARDAIYVGDDNGVLHKFINAFGLTGTTPSEVTTGNWPITVQTGTILTSPTLDTVSGNIFTGDTGGHLRYVRETFSTAGTCLSGAAPCLGTNVINPALHVIPDAPIVDPSTGKVLVFFGNDGTGTSVIQSDITLTGMVQASLGTGTGHHLHSGAFDNAYITGNGSAGRLYTCGSSAGSVPTIQRIGFTNSGRSPASPFANPVGTMNAAVDAATLTIASGSAECTPVTEFFNSGTSTDRIFFGVLSLGNLGTCGGGGCVMSINITGIPATLTLANSIAESGGPSGITVDNASASAQASSLYFSTQTNTTCNGTANQGCAVKVTQSGLN
jgi:hypothetical protein